MAALQDFKTSNPLRSGRGKRRTRKSPLPEIREPGRTGIGGRLAGSAAFSLTKPSAASAGFNEVGSPLEASSAEIEDISPAFAKPGGGSGDATDSL